MVSLEWDKTGERFYETGVDQGVLYPVDQSTGNYKTGVAWNGLVTVTESPSGAEANPQYADNIKYLNLYSAEEFGATIEAFYSPEEFDVCDGSASPAKGLIVTQQARTPFGFSYRTLVGNDLQGNDYSERIHIIYNAMASPSEKARNTINDSPEATTLSWEVTTSPIAFPGLKATAHVYVNKHDVSEEDWTALTNLLYGTEEDEPRLPTPQELLTLLSDEEPEDPENP